MSKSQLENVPNEQTIQVILGEGKVLVAKIIKSNIDRHN